jgi:cell division protein FtsI (penicillin-binding protein 3)
VQGWNRDFYIAQGQKRYEHTFEQTVNRGRLLDRNGEILAIDQRVFDVWVSPPVLSSIPFSQSEQLSNLLGVSQGDISSRAGSDRQFAYLQKGINSDLAAQVSALNIDGVYLKQASKRYYPNGSDYAQLVGFVGADDHGLEGLERALDTKLSGRGGESSWIVDRRGRPLEAVDTVSDTQPPKDIVVSIDRRLQYITRAALQSGIDRTRAKGGSAIVLDAHTGEILALVSLPTFDPNQPIGHYDSRLRNQALDDAFEPGSTIKPATVALALQEGVVTPNTTIDTSPGSYTIYGSTIHDTSNFGKISVTQVIAKSSNIGMAHIAQKLSARDMWQMFHALGVGERPLANEISAGSGRLHPASHWHPIERLTMAYGYGLSVTLAQLADIYTVFANDGRRVPLSLQKLARAPQGIAILTSKVAKQIRGMLAEDGLHGTARIAALPDYDIGGKTGTARKQAGRGYAAGKYRALFSGFAPVSNPRLIVAVMIDEPTKGKYYGGPVSGPVFASIMEQSLHLLGVQPDREGRPRGTSRRPSM